MRISSDKTMAVAVDFQERLIPAMYNQEETIRTAGIPLAGPDAPRVPVLVCRRYPKGLGDTVPEIRAVTAGAVTMDKTAFSFYADEAIKQMVDDMRRKTIILCGVEAHVCVLQSAPTLLHAGYQVAVVADCVDFRKKGDKECGFKRIAAEGVKSPLFRGTLHAGQRFNRLRRSDSSEP